MFNKEFLGGSSLSKQILTKNWHHFLSVKSGKISFTGITIKKMILYVELLPEYWQNIKQ